MRSVRQVSAWDGYISGRNLELIPAERIVQTWRTSEFTDEHEDSVISIVLEEVGDGTLLTLEHSNVPDEHRSYEEGGWQSNYFEPMVAYFTELRGAGRSEPPEQPVQQSRAKVPPQTCGQAAGKDCAQSQACRQDKVKARRGTDKGGEKENQGQRKKEAADCCREASQKRKANGTQIGSPQTKISRKRRSRDSAGVLFMRTGRQR